MDSMEANKVIAAVLVAGIAFFVTGTIADNLIVEHHLEKTVLKIEGAPTTAGTSGPKKVELPPLAPLLAKADVQDGEKYTHKVCVACHTFNKGGKAGVGPNLYGIVGAKHGHMAGFNYSNAIKEKKGPWNYAELNEWLHKPSSYAPGTRMGFAGISNAQTRADVIAYLKSISPDAPPLPSPEAAKPAEKAAPAAGNGKAVPEKASAGNGKAEPAKASGAAPAKASGAAPANANGGTPAKANGGAPAKANGEAAKPAAGGAPAQPAQAAPNK